MGEEEQDMSYLEECEKAYGEVRELRAQVESLTRQLAAYEAEPVVGYIGDSKHHKMNFETLEMFEEDVRALVNHSLLPNSVALIRKPTSTEHLEALIAEAVAKEREECAKLVELIGADWQREGYDLKFYAAEYLTEAIRARVQKG